jgi:hypothetical protein
VTSRIPSIRKLRKASMSLRAIAQETSLALHTVRTILGKAEGADRTTMKHLARIDPDRARAACWKSRKRTRDALPKQINESLKTGREGDRAEQIVKKKTPSVCLRSEARKRGASLSHSMHKRQCTSVFDPTLAINLLGFCQSSARPRDRARVGEHREVCSPLGRASE